MNFRELERCASSNAPVKLALLSFLANLWPPLEIRSEDVGIGRITSERICVGCTQGDRAVVAAETLSGANGATVRIPWHGCGLEDEGARCVSEIGIRSAQRMDADRCASEQVLERLAYCFQAGFAHRMAIADGFGRPDVHRR